MGMPLQECGLLFAGSGIADIAGEEVETYETPPKWLLYCTIRSCRCMSMCAS